MGDLFKSNGIVKSLEDLKAKFDLDDNREFYWIQIVHQFLKFGKKGF